MSVDETIKSTVEGHKVVIYMKGNASMPQCGFSAATVDIFKQLGVKIETVNVLADPTIREGIKQFTKWPTIPQVFVGGKFIGGCDIVREMFQSGELVKTLDAAGVQHS